MITLMSEINKTHLFSFELKYILCIYRRKITCETCRFLLQNEDSINGD